MKIRWYSSWRSLYLIPDHVFVRSRGGSGSTFLGLSLVFPLAPASSHGFAWEYLPSYSAQMRTARIRVVVAPVARSWDLLSCSPWLQPPRTALPGSILRAIRPRCRLRVYGAQVGFSDDKFTNLRFADDVLLMAGSVNKSQACCGASGTKSLELDCSATQIK